jgi:hypothetical protein
MCQAPGRLTYAANLDYYLRGADVDSLPPTLLYLLVVLDDDAVGVALGGRGF